MVDAGGVRVLPALSGLGASWWNASARGLVAGLTGARRPAHIARAALDAIASREPIRPRRDAGWRAREHAAWRRFVEAACGVANETMSQDTDDRDDVGAEGGDNENADTLPPLPSEDDDSPLGDTDQHSSAPPTEHDMPKD
ncbi:FGGY-family carbohydrate kinase [Capillimicrobium parvum]|uniref:Glycerol kinase n=1 Tax=Capillimicrobium parvum TaxID=2884022 RepID=A0A9E6XVV9_9ACTN|nr:FGGY-family carbohydrate kinase [Capillimicrobium parvum]UGS35381.1 Glycerol kinase [Capillimicrobium parvum]